MQVDREHAIAKRVSFLSAVLMLGVALVGGLVTGVFICAEIANPGAVDLGQSLLITVGQLVAEAFILLLASFLWHANKEASPFGKAQGTRLLAAGMLLVVRTLIDNFTASLPEGIGLGPVTLTTEPSIDLKSIAIMIFMIALAFILRYGEALKEDSDSIA